MRWLFGVVICVVGCGYSPHMAHQSQGYFEHCHAADLDPERSIEEREACWAAWLEHYASPLRPARIDHARRRLAALGRGDEVPAITGGQYTGAILSGAEAPPQPPEVAVGPPLITLHRASVAPAVVNADAPRGPTRAEAALEDTYDAPRPRLSEPQPIPEVEEAPPPVPRELSSTPCGPICGPRWDRCLQRCDGYGAGCVNACRSQFEVCMGACF